MTKYKNGFKVVVKEWDNVIRVFKKDSKGKYSVLVHETKAKDYVRASVILQAL